MMESQQRHGVDLIFPTAIKAILRILNHHNIATCIIGELAYNYYNVPDVVHVSLNFVARLLLTAIHFCN